ncbi:MAG: 4-alpha-glucanotransferase [Streptococcaceae bacterium]|jgi:4-alpha-glucanotransferase|nr:4-alpha-glucanotransferase [Streptococcaceae bacterium]
MTKDFQLKPYGARPFHTGVAVPVFSLRGEEDFGVGDFTDLIKFSNVIKELGFDLIQLLPVNDTTIFLNWKDSSPYRANSVFALHPIYLGVNAFKVFLDAMGREEFEAERKALNALENVDYEKTLALKWKYARIVFDKVRVAILEEKGFVDFFEERKSWLEPYAAFCYIRDQFQTSEIEKWGSFQKYSDEILTSLKEDDEILYELELIYFVQYLLHLQLKEASVHCHSIGVALKGDIAIGVGKDSADTWAQPDIVNLDKSAGAPPDAFSKTGQNWAFPTYNWEAMKENDYAWWKSRLRTMAEYFDAYRLDHILGFFRIWQIPLTSVRGLLGHFSPAIGLTIEEIEQNYGIPYREWGGGYRFTDPFIKDWVVQEIVGWENKDMILNTYLQDRGWGNYEFKEEFNTQAKIDAALEEGWIKNALFTLHENVIFVQDSNNPELLHPRVELMNTSSWREFGEPFRNQLARLHEEYFYHRNTDYWGELAKEKLPQIIHASNMLPCGEDLGMVPSNVPFIMGELEILRLIVERMPSIPGHMVNDLDSAPYLSVATPSSHDTSTLRMWWEEDPDFTKDYFHYIMKKGGEVPETATTDVMQEIIYRHMDCNAMLTVFTIQDLFGVHESTRVEDPRSEKINDTSKPFHYWRYRVHLTNEEMMEKKEWIERIKSMVQHSKRVRPGE